jgi:hypothetical protein
VRGGRLPALAGVAFLLTVSVGCGRPGAGAKEADATVTSPTHTRLDEEIELADGRRVGVSYAAGRGLLEQHQDAEAGAWSKPRLVYRTASEPCQSITLKAFGSTVAVMANWGRYCADGEPPTESIAGVGSRNLSRWDMKLTKDFDGWTKVAAVGDPQHLRFTRVSTEWLTRLRWSREEGFAEVEQNPR